MSLFKILRGAEANLASATLHDGWAYFTPDAENFYIDADGKRIWVNQKPSNMYISIPTVSWEDRGTYWAAVLPWDELKTSINLSRYMLQLNLPSGFAADTIELTNRVIYAQPFIAENDENSLTIGAARCPLGEIMLAVTLIPLENTTEGNGQVYSIVYNLTNCSGSTDKKVAKYGESIDVTFSATSGSGWTGSVTMGGSVVTGAIINGSGGASTARVVLNKITGNVVINITFA